MDEKERLSGVDVEIQNHAEQDHAQNVPAPDFLVLALFLAPILWADAKGPGTAESR